MSDVLSMKDLMEYRYYLENEEKSAATVEKYLRDLRTFFVFCQGKMITKEMNRAYKRFLEQGNYAAKTVNAKLASVNSLMRFLHREDCVVKTVRIQRQMYQENEMELTLEEYQSLLEATRGDVMLHLLIQTIAATGIRVSEIKYFTVEAVKMGYVTVDCKGKIRKVLIPRKLQKKLLNYSRECDIRSGVIFLGKSGMPMDRSVIWRKIKGLSKCTGINPKKLFPHNLRKLFAREFYEMKKDIAKLADLLGHSSIETTRIYIMGTGVEHREEIERMGLLFEDSEESIYLSKNRKNKRRK